MSTTVNLVEINPYLWLVRTQAGYRKLLKSYTEKRNTEPKRIKGYPKVYPCMVTFNRSMNPEYFAYADITPVNDSIAARFQDLALIGEHDLVVKHPLFTIVVDDVNAKESE